MQKEYFKEYFEDKIKYSFQSMGKPHAMLRAPEWNAQMTELTDRPVAGPRKAIIRWREKEGFNHRC
jgi:hypothetical protein